MSILKKIVSAMLVVFMLPVYFVGIVFAQENSSATVQTFQSLLDSGDKYVDKLYCLGVLSPFDMELDINGELTRAEFVEMAVNLMNYGEINDAEIPYIDVPTDYWASGYIGAAHQYGLIASAESFRPTAGITYNECIKILVEAMGYGHVAGQQGGYPDGYLDIASMINLNRRISGLGESIVIRKDVLKLLDNALEANVLSNNYPGYTISDESFLEEHLKINVFKGKVEEIFFKERRVRVTINGQSTAFDLNDKININGMIEDDADIYIYDDPKVGEIIQYIEFKGTMQVYYDFLYEVNGESNPNAHYGYGTVRSIFLRNENKKFNVPSDAIIYCDDIDAREQAVALHNTFAKIVVSEREVVRIEAYNLKPGGIIYRADSDKIKYIKGDVNDNVIEGFEEVEDLRIFIDGKQYASMYDLKDSMVFDYWVNSQEDKFIIVASSRVHEKKMDSYGSDEIILEGQTYEIDPRYGLYVYSNTKARYMLNDSVSAYMGNVVKVFVDDNKYVRYIKIDENVENASSFLGIVMKGYTDDFNDQISLKIYKVSGDNGEKTYKVREKMRNSPISPEYAASVAKNLDGKGFFKFTLNKSNEIIKIEEPDLWGARTSVSGSISETTSYWLNNLYVRYATIFALVEDKGQFTVKLLDWDTHLRRKAFNEPLIVTSDYDPLYNPIADYVMITGGASSIHYSGNVERFIIDLKHTYDEEESEAVVEFTTVDRYGTYKHKISPEEAERLGLKKGVRIEATTDYIVGDNIRISKVIDTSVDPDLWPVDNETFSLNATSGFYRADKILYRDGEVAQFMVNGEATDVMPLNEYYVCYEMIRTGKGNQFVVNKKVNPLGYIDSADNVWFAIYNWGPSPRSIGYVIYENTGMVP